MRDRYQEFRDQGAEVLVVSFTPPEFLAMYLREQPLPFPVVSDPSRQAYHALGLERTTFLAMLRPGIAARILRLIARGWRIKRPRKGEDLLQLGGNFILDAQRRLIFAHCSSDPTGRPPVGDLLKALQLGLH